MKPKSNAFTCSICKRHLPGNPPGHFTPGYARSGPKGPKVCYDCAAMADAQWMCDKGRIALYLDESKPRWRVTNWPGSLSFPAMETRSGHHNIGRSRSDVWFRGPDGFMWWGVSYGDNTQICHCRRTKVRWAKPRV